MSLLTYLFYSTLQFVNNVPHGDGVKSEANFRQVSASLNKFNHVYWRNWRNFGRTSHLSEGWRTFKPWTFQPQASTLDISTLDFSNPDFSTMNFSTRDYSTMNSSTTPPVDLYLISEKSIWKNPVQQTGPLVYFELDLYCLCSLQKSISKLIFAGKKFSSSYLIFPTWFFKIQVQINRGSEFLIPWGLKTWTIGVWGHFKCKVHLVKKSGVEKSEVEEFMGMKSLRVLEGELWKKLRLHCLGL